MKRLLLAALLFAAACGSSPTGSSPQLVTYKVDGSAIRADMTYSGSGGTTRQTSGASLPWQYSFVPETVNDFLYISAQNAGSSGCVHVAIYLGNASTTSPIKDAQSCGAFVIATASR